MIAKVRDLRHVTVEAVDGRIGFVEQVFFDDERWTIRYLVVDTGSEFQDRRVLVSPLAVTGMRGGSSEAIQVRLRRQQVAGSPEVDTDKPVSRQREIEYNRYYMYPRYWGGEGIWGSFMLPVQLLEPPQEASVEAQGQADVHLRSSREVIGYRVRAKDGRVGHVEDFLYEGDNWRIRYVEVDTRNWIGGRHVLVSPRWASAVNWGSRTISLDLDVETIRGAPEFGSLSDLSPAYEEAIRSHFARPLE